MHQATPKLPRDQFRRVCYDAIDLIVSAIDQSFNQESFRSYARMETLLVKTANGDDYDTELKFLEASYSEGVDTEALPWLATKYWKLCERRRYHVVSRTRKGANSGSPNYL